MSRTEVINAVYNAALNLNTVDKDSFSDFTKDGFYFTVDGMYCAYNYRLRNELNTDCAPVEEEMCIRDRLIPGELLERIEAAGGTYEFHVMEIMPTTDAIGHGGYIEGIYVDFECAAGVEMTGNLFTYTSTVCNVPDVYKRQALSLNTVDKDSFSAFTKDGFYFTVDGMYCAYNYRPVSYTHLPRLSAHNI